MMRWSAILLALCLATPAQAELPPCDAEAIEVATLNTWGLPYPLSRNRSARFQQIRTWLDSGIDIIGLQEVWSSAQTLLAPRLRLPGSKADSGLAVVTPHPTTQPTLTPFTASRGVDAWKSKGVLTTRVSLPDGSHTWVAVTHLQAGHSEKNAAVRAAQVDQLIRVVSALDGPALVMGDFNLYDDLESDRQSSQRLREKGYADAARLHGATGPTYRTGTERLDRIYTRSGKQLNVRVTDAKVGRKKSLSDHLPVEASVRLCSPD